MSAEFVPSIELVEVELAKAELLIRERERIGLDDRSLIGYPENVFRREVEVRFPSPNELSFGGAIFSDDTPENDTERVRYEDPIEYASLTGQLELIVRDAKVYWEKIQAAANWMVSAYSQAFRINNILGDMKIYYEQSEDYLQGIGARFEFFGDTEEKIKSTSDIVIVTGVYKDSEHSGRLIHVQPLLNIAWILPAKSAWIRMVH